MKVTKRASRKAKQDQIDSLNIAIEQWLAILDKAETEEEIEECEWQLFRAKDDLDYIRKNGEGSL
jgi:cob(I)alamin adenosyltransferase